MKSISLFIVGVGLFIALGLAGECDRVDTIIYNMPDDVRIEIRKELTIHGKEPSDKQIADYYMEHYNK